MSAKLYTLNLSIKFFKNYYEFNFIVVLINIHIFAKQRYKVMGKKIISKIKVCCPDECDNTPTEEIEVGNELHIYCCEKGFAKTMEEFINSPFKEPHTITDEAVAPRESTTNDMNLRLNGLLIVFRL